MLEAVTNRRSVSKKRPAREDRRGFTNDIESTSKVVAFPAKAGGGSQCHWKLIQCSKFSGDGRRHEPPNVFNGEALEVAPRCAWPDQGMEGVKRKKKVMLADLGWGRWGKSNRSMQSE